MSARTSYVNPSPTITAAQISDATAFGRLVLQLGGTPGGILATDISNNPMLVTGMDAFLGWNNSGLVANYDASSAAGLISLGTGGFNGTVTPVNQIEVTNGIVTAAV